jgi:integrase/recombinase XerD
VADRPDIDVAFPPVLSVGTVHEDFDRCYRAVSSAFRTRTLRCVLDQTIKDALSFGEEIS